MNRTMVKGCGIGCGVVALLFLVLVGGGAWFARQMGQEYKVVEKTEAELIEAHGGLIDWTPPPGLVPPADRVEAFAAVRAATGEWRARLDTDIARFVTERETGGGVGKLWRMMRSGSDLGLTYARFWTARNRALLDAGMGPAEYAWLYGLFYYARQGYDPAAGAGRLDVQRTGGFEVTIEAGEPDPGTAARRRAHDLLAPMVAAAAPDTAGVTAAELAAERAALASDPERVPWQDGLPIPVAAAFTPVAPRLDAAWSEAVNPLELMFDLEAWAQEQQEKQEEGGG